LTPSKPIPRLALSKREAAEALGISVDHLERYVLEHVRVAYVGSRRLIPVLELERYLAEHAGEILRK
jgi:excisionase family DNA binding protein